MAAYTKPTRSELRTMVRYKLADQTARWWPNTQLDLYIDAWYSELNKTFECNWAITTWTATSQFTTQTAIATDIHRIHSIRRASDSIELPYMSVYHLNEIHRDFRWITGTVAGAWYEEEGKIGIFPSPSSAVELTAEYVQQVTLATDTSTAGIPAWMKYSVIPYVCWKAYAALGPMHDPAKAQRYKARFQWWINRYRSVQNRWFAVRPLSLKVDTGLIEKLRSVKESLISSGELTMPGIVSLAPSTETPSGDINGTNTVFTLSTAPSALLLIINNASMIPNVHYTLSGGTITMAADYVPKTGWDMVAYYWT